MISSMLRQGGAALRMLLLATVVLGLVYPLAVWGVSRLPGLHGPAEGSLLPGNTGSALIGIDPVAPDPGADPYFHTRPSAAAPGASGGSNLGGDSAKLLDQVQQRRAAIAAREGVAPAAVPAAAVTAAGAGLDPHISPAYADLQVGRVARVTGLPAAQVRTLVAGATHGRVLGFLGERTVNVTELNLAVAAAR